MLSVLLRYTDSDYHFGICWQITLCYLFFFAIRILITTLVSVGHCVICSSSLYRRRILITTLGIFWAIVLSVLLRYTDSDYHFGICWPLCYLFFAIQKILITTLVSVGHCVICSSSLYGLTLDYHFGISWPNRQHNGQQKKNRYVLSVLRYTDSDYHFGISKLFLLLIYIVSFIYL